MITHLEPDILECEVKWASGSIIKNKASGGDGIPVELSQILKRWCCERAALNMPANLENSAVATGLEKVSFHSNLEERQCQIMLKLPHNCTHLIKVTLRQCTGITRCFIIPNIFFNPLKYGRMACWRLLWRHLLGDSLRVSATVLCKQFTCQCRRHRKQRFLEKEMATWSSFLARRIPWTEELGGLQSRGCRRFGHDWPHTIKYSIGFKSTAKI